MYNNSSNSYHFQVLHVACLLSGAVIK